MQELSLEICFEEPNVFVIVINLFAGAYVLFKFGNLFAEAKLMSLL